MKRKYVIGTLVLLLCSIIPAHASSPDRTALSPSGDIVVEHISNDTVSWTAVAENADLRALLKKVAETCGINIEIGAGVSGKVSISLADFKLEEGISRPTEAAEAKNFAAEFKTSGEDEDYPLEKIVVVKKAEGKTVIGKTVPRTREAVREYLKKEYGTEWAVFWDDRLSKPRSVIGMASIEPMINKISLGREFIEGQLRHLAPIFRLDVDQIEFDKQEEDTTTYYYNYHQTFNDIRVEHSILGGSILKKSEDGRQNIRIFAYTYPDIAISTTPKLTAAEAERVAAAHYRVNWRRYAVISNPDISYEDIPEEQRRAGGKAELVIVPVEINRGYEYHLCWVLRFGAADYAIDAQTAAIVSASALERSAERNSPITKTSTQ